MNKINFAKTAKMLVVLSAFALLVPLAQIKATSASTVYIYDNSYSPQTLTVPVGTTVTWINSGNSQHTVTSDSGSFSSGTLYYGSSYNVSFGTAGTYQYHCSYNGSAMSGTIIVTDGGSSNSTTNSLTATVQASTPIVVNQITPVQTTASADGTYANGWKWIFDVTAPSNETTLMMKFSNWLNSSSSTTIPVSNNMRFYSTQSSNAYSESTAITIGSANAYSSGMYLTGDLDTVTSTRRVQITVQIKIPAGTTAGSYSTNYGIKTQ